MMKHMNWLLKEEPANYAFDALLKDKRTVWSGVKNPVAQKHLHAVKKGDRLFYYHTGNEKSVVGIAEALTDAYPDPKDNLQGCRRGYRTGEEACQTGNARRDQVRCRI